MNRRLLAMPLVCLVLVPACNRQETTPSAAQQATPPSAATATPGEVRLPADSPQLRRVRVEVVRDALVALEEVVAPGRIEANPAGTSRVAIPIAGRVKRVMVAMGDAVTQGSPLLSIESPEVGASTSAYQQAEARVTQARTAQAKAEADLSRVKDLYANRAIAQKEVLVAEASLSQVRSDLAQAEATRQEVLRRLQIFGLKPGDYNQEILVRAPGPGKVLEISVAAGEYRNDTSAPLLTIADLRRVYMAADVPESLIRLIHSGESVEVTLAAYPGEVFSARVARIADTVDPQTRTIKVRAELANPKERLRPDMFGEMRHKEGFRRAPIVPAGAVIQGERQSVVYREKSTGVFEPVAVTFGKADGARIPILSGLSSGDRVVVDGATLLKGSL